MNQVFQKIVLYLDNNIWAQAAIPITLSAMALGIFRAVMLALS